jgi:hypothetical protein
LHRCDWQLLPLAQRVQAPPPEPQSVLLVPALQTPFVQQPFGQVRREQPATQAPFAQVLLLEHRRHGPPLVPQA